MEKINKVEMRRFYLYRREDVSGISGTGVIAEGVEFTDGSAVLRWFGKYTSTCIYQDTWAIEKIHGHDGKTVLMWMDEA